MGPRERRRPFGGWAIFLGLIFAVAGGCDREQLEEACTPLQAGDLVITELRNGGADDLCGTWIEIHNPTAERISAPGLFLDILKGDGSASWSILVRDRELSIEPGGYLVLGGSPDSSLPQHMDYSFKADYTLQTGSETPSWYAAGILTLSSCDELVDKVVYRDLPDGEALILDGAVAPDAANNDLADVTDPGSAWCLDEIERSNGVCDPGFVDVYGTPGTPGAENPTCASQPI